MPADERELLERWRCGDNSAGSALFDRHYRALHHFFANKVNTEVEDLVQDTFLAVLNSSKPFRGHSSFRTYLFAIALNRFYQYLKTRQRIQAPLDYSVSSLMDLGITPRTRLDRAHEHRLLLLALRSLPVEHQVMLELRYWERMSSSDIAEIFGTTRQAMDQRMHRVRKSLGTHLRKLADRPPRDIGADTDMRSWLDSMQRHLAELTREGENGRQ